MGFDLTNQNISDTFQNLLQKTGSNNQLYDLKGNQITDLTIAGTLYAQNYAVTSSVTSMSIVYASGSTIFGDTSDDTHQFYGDTKVTGSLTISGSAPTSKALVNIKQSGLGEFFEIRNRSGSRVLRVQQSLYGGAHLDIFGSGSVNNWISHQFVDPWSNNASYVNYSNHERPATYFGIGISSPTEHLHVSGNIKLTGNIIYETGDDREQRVAFGGADTGSGKTLTVEGDISASGDIFIDSGKIKHTNDEDTFIDFAGNEILLHAGDATFFKQSIGSDGTAFGLYEQDNNFGFYTSNDTTSPLTSTLWIDGGTSNVGIGVGVWNATISPPKALTVEGDISASGDLDVQGAITSSYDTDSVSYFGRSFVGTSPSLYNVYSDYAMFGHIDQINAGGIDGYALYQTANGATAINSNDSLLAFQVDTYQAMVISGSNGSSWGGNVGIGTTKPSKPLTVAGHISASGLYLGNGEKINLGDETRLYGNSGQFFFISASLPALPPTAATVLMKISQSQGDTFVGIGTGTTKLSKTLTVQGDISASGEFYAMGSSSFGTNATSSAQLTIEGDISASGALKLGTGKSQFISSSGAGLVGNAGYGLQIRNTALDPIADLDDINQYQLQIVGSPTTDEGMGICFNTYDGANPVRAGGAIIYKNFGSYGRGELHFYTKHQIGIYNPTERMKMGEDGITVKGSISASGDLFLNNNQFIYHRDASGDLQQSLRRSSDTLYVGDSSDGQKTCIYGDNTSIVLSGSRVGIETGFDGDNPIPKTLTVSGSISASGDLYVKNSFLGGTTGLGTNLVLGHVDLITPTGTSYALSQASNGHTYLNCATGKYIQFQENSNVKMVITGSRVGIGNIYPTKKLTVEGDISASGDLYGKSTSGVDFGIISASSTELTVFGDISASGVTYSSQSVIHGGDSSITPAPGTGLTVQGDISASGDMYLETTKQIIGRDSAGDLQQIINFEPGGAPYIGFGDTNLETSLIGDGAQLTLSESRFGFGNTEPSKTLTVQGDISASGVFWAASASIGDTTLNGTGSGKALTVTGDISASGTIYGSNALLGTPPLLPTYFGISHIDRFNYTDFAVAQSATGVTWVNAAASQQLYFSIGAVKYIWLNDDGKVKIGLGITAPEKTLTVQGDIYQKNKVDGSPQSYKIYADGDISASGAIYSEGTIFGNQFFDTSAAGGSGAYIVSASISGALWVTSSNDNFIYRESDVTIGTSNYSGKTLTVEGDISASGTIHGAPIHVKLADNDDYHLAATYTQNAWYGTNYVNGQSLGTTIGSESVTNLIYSTNYIAPSDVILNKVTWLVFAADISGVSSYDYEFRVYKIPFVSGNNTAITPTEIVSDIPSGSSMTENYPYVINMTFSGSSDAELSAGEALMITARNTTSGTNKLQLKGAVNAELRLK